MFKPGDRVKCVDDSPYKHCGEPSGLVKRKTYTVLALNAHGTSIALKEVPATHREGNRLREERFILASAVAAKTLLLCPAKEA